MLNTVLALFLIAASIELFFAIIDKKRRVVFWIATSIAWATIWWISGYKN